jgi:AcrR family transcriptional regulator
VNVQSTRAERAEERKVQLIQLAMTLFAEEGWAGTSMRKLAQRARVSQGLIYHYFSSKEELLLQVADHYSLAPVLGSIVQAQEGRPVREGLLTICRELYAHLCERRDIYWILFRETNNHPELCARLEGTRCDFIEHLKAYLQTGIEAGELKSHNSQVLAECLLRVLFLASLDSDPPEPLIEVFLDAILGGLLR